MISLVNKIKISNIVLLLTKLQIEAKRYENKLYLIRNKKIAKTMIFKWIFKKI